MDANLPQEAMDLFQRLRFDLNVLFEKISEDAKSNPQIVLNAAVEEAYLRSLVVAGVLMPMPEDSVFCINTSTDIH